MGRVYESDIIHLELSVALGGLDPSEVVGLSKEGGGSKSPRKLGRPSRREKKL